MNHTFLRFPDFRRKAVTLSYDDGVKYDRQLMEIMDRHGLKGTFNINSELFGDVPGGRRLTREEAVELYANSPHEVAVHGARHLSLDEVDAAAAPADVIKDRENLERLFGRIIKGMAYANGSCSQKTAQILANCGIHYSRTTVSTECFSLPTDWLLMSATCHHENPRLMELAKKFVETENVRYHWTNRPMLFYLWGHSYEFNDKDNWHIIEDFAEYIGNRPDIWYATNGEIYDYVQAFDRLEYSADGKVIYNPTCTDLYLCYYGENVYVPGGQTVRL